ncbi:MAG: RDD family protein [Syntrophorhabdaceae bacterium]|nr:RDD family protein [Syntrophorhabdaceae bacterium]
MRKAPFFSRFMAFALDLFIVFMVSTFTLAAIVTGYMIGCGGSFFYSIIDGIGILSTIFFISHATIFIFYFTYLSAGDGSTIGKDIFSIKVKRLDGMDINLSVSFIRCMSYLVSASIFFLGFFMALIFKGRSLHDFIANTLVIEDTL